MLLHINGNSSHQNHLSIISYHSLTLFISMIFKRSSNLSRAHLNVQFALLRRNISPLVSISRCRLKYSIDTHVRLQFSASSLGIKSCDPFVTNMSYPHNRICSVRLVLSFSSLSFFWQVLVVHLQIFLDDQSFRLVYCSRYPEEELGNAYNIVQTITSSKYYSFPFASCSSL